MMPYGLTSGWQQEVLRAAGRPLPGDPDHLERAIWEVGGLVAAFEELGFRRREKTHGEHARRIAKRAKGLLLELSKPSAAEVLFGGDEDQLQGLKDAVTCARDAASVHHDQACRDEAARNGSGGMHGFPFKSKERATDVATATGQLVLKAGDGPEKRGGQRRDSSLVACTG